MGWQPTVAGQCQLVIWLAVTTDNLVPSAWSSIHLSGLSSINDWIFHWMTRLHQLFRIRIFYYFISVPWSLCCTFFSIHPSVSLIENSIPPEDEQFYRPLGCLRKTINNGGHLKWNDQRNEWWSSGKTSVAALNEQFSHNWLSWLVLSSPNSQRQPINDGCNVGTESFHSDSYMHSMSLSGQI